MSVTMSTSRVRQLCNFVPGFKNDKDEEWACYLPSKDQLFLRKSRKQYLIMMDNLDGLKLEKKEGDSSPELEDKMKALTRQIDSFIQTVLHTIPNLKERGLQAREKRIEEDLNGGGQVGNSSRMDPTYEDESEILDSLGAFMPRTNRVEPSTSAPRTQQHQPMDIDQAQYDAGQQVDNYLDDVEPDNVEIMLKLRSLVERFKCKEPILEALRRSRHRDSRLALLDDLRPRKSKAVASKNHNSS
jgi:hypothetical protein